MLAIAATDSERALVRQAFALLEYAERPDPLSWCEREVFIIDKESKYQGHFTTRNAPYLRGPLQRVGDPAVRGIVLMWGTQLFKTTLLIAVASYLLKNDPGPLLWLFDSRDNARDFSKDRWQMVVKNSPMLRALMPTDGDDFANLEQKFETATLHFAGSNSLGRVSSKPKRFIIRDEIDKYRGMISGEAGAIEQSSERTKSFPDYKTIDASSPSTWFGPINQRFLLGTRERYFLISPYVGDRFALTFSGLKWDPACKDLGSGVWDLEGVEETAYYEDPFTGEPITESMKVGLLDNDARWVPENELLESDEFGPYRECPQGGWVEKIPEDERRMQRDYSISSFQLSSMYSQHANCSFGKIARKHVEAGQEPSKRTIFTNGWLAEVSREKAKKLDHNPLLERLEDYGATPVPPGVLVIVGAVDLQEGGDGKPPRFEYEIVGVGLHGETWGLEFGIITADPKSLEGWDVLENDVLQRLWKHPCGATLPVAAFGVDTGYATHEAYDFIARREDRRLRSGHRQRVFALKGYDGKHGDPIYSRPRKTTVDKVSLYMVSRYAANQAVHKALTTNRPKDWIPGDAVPGFQHFRRGPGYNCPGYDAEYFRQLVSEYLVYEYKGGYKVGKYRKRGANEALAVRRYWLAAYHLLNADLNAINHRFEQMEIVAPSTGPVSSDDAEQPSPPKASPAQRVPRPPKPRVGGWKMGGF